MLNFIFKTKESDFICCDINGKQEIYDIQSNHFINFTHPHRKSVITEINQTIIQFSSEISGRFIMDKIKIVAFDFGCTIAQTGVSKYKDRFEDLINDPNLYRNIIIGNWNLEIFGILVNTLKENGIHVVIASNGNREVEYALLKDIMKEKKTIITQRVVSIYQTCKNYYYKNNEINRIFYISFPSYFKMKLFEYDNMKMNIYQENFEETLRIIFPNILQEDLILLYDKKGIPDKSIMLEIALLISNTELTYKDIEMKHKKSVLLIDDKKKNIDNIIKSEYRGLYILPSICKKRENTFNTGFIFTFDIINKSLKY
jgi:hypothetical protein